MRCRILIGRLNAVETALEASILLNGLVVITCLLCSTSLRAVLVGILLIRRAITIIAGVKLLLVRLLTCCSRLLCLVRLSFVVGLLSNSSLGLVTRVWVTAVCPCLFLSNALKCRLVRSVRF